MAGENPRPWEYDGEFSEPDSATWSLARFSLQKEDGSWIDVEMIRPAEYWEQQGAVPGELTYVEFPELEASGLAKVTSIEPCPPIASGSGQVVTARIVTRQVAELVEIEFVGGETLTGTPQHPIWSIERQDWAELGDLEVGEHLWTEAGPIEISSTRLLSTGESVYNLEVHGHHIYQVSELGVLVHNANWLDKYRTRSVASTKKLRKEFNNSKRAEFLKNLAKDPKSVLRFTADQLKLMAKGIVPKGFVGV
ncbi:Hint domain-containing protein [Pirellulaceae bacterium SH449]